MRVYCSLFLYTYTCISIGLYVSRQLSFSSVQFQIQEVPLTQAYIEVYNISCKFWFECKQKFLQAMKLLIFDNRKVKIVMALFWAAHQRFFKYLCIASKVVIIYTIKTQYSFLTPHKTPEISNMLTHHRIITSS